MLHQCNMNCSANILVTCTLLATFTIKLLESTFLTFPTKSLISTLYFMTAAWNGILPSHGLTIQEASHVIDNRGQDNDNEDLATNIVSTWASPGFWILSNGSRISSSVSPNTSSAKAVSDTVCTSFNTEPTCFLSWPLSHLVANVKSPKAYGSSDMLYKEIGMEEPQ